MQDEDRIFLLLKSIQLSKKVAQEIERKFLVNGDFIEQAEKKFVITQAYLSLDKERTIRIRIQNEKAYITIKGISNSAGLTRYEWEKEIDLVDARELLNLAIGKPIEKIRYYIPVGKHIFEVDIFSGENKGLIIAEVELISEKEEFEKPQWLGKEVSGDSRYYNASLISNPFCNWSNS